MTEIKPVYSVPDVCGHVPTEPPTPAVMAKKVTKAKTKAKKATPPINPADAKVIDGMRRTLNNLDATITHLRQERDDIRQYIAAAAATLSVRANDGKDQEK